MKSPFPGMDPYLERHWLDVHTALVDAATRALNAVLPGDLAARAEERLAVEVEDDEKLRGIAPDVQVFEPGISEPSAGVAITAPFKLVVNLDPITERFIKIIRADDERLITVIEFISPTNKGGRGLEKYLDKRDELVRSDIHVVEIDLVRKGDWRRILEPHLCPVEAVATYRAVVRLGGRRGDAYLYPMSIRRPLPAVTIPLRRQDPKIELDLQRLITSTYQERRYGQTLDYSRLPDPPLDPEDAAWADELLKVAGKR